MAVVGSAKERPDQRTGGEKDDGSRWYSRVYLVITDNTSDGVAEVLRAPDLPAYKDHYETDTETDTQAIVVRRKPRQLKETRFHWDVTVRYETRSAKDREKNPLLRPVEMSFDADEREVPVIGTLVSTITFTPDSTQIYKKPLRNSMWMPFRTQPLVKRSNGILTAIQNEDSFSPAWAMAWGDAVNEDAWGGAEPRQLKLKTPTCAGSQTETVDEEEVIYYPVVYQMEYKEEGHDLRQLDEGPDYWTKAMISIPAATATTASTAVAPSIKASTVYVSTAYTGAAETRAFVDGDGRPFIGKLDGHGRPLKCNPGFSTSVYTTLSSSVTGVFLKFQHYKEKPWGELGLPEEFV